MNIYETRVKCVKLDTKIKENQKQNKREKENQNSKEFFLSIFLTDQTSNIYSHFPYTQISPIGQ